ncbi:glycosyltransferase family 2 protein [Candidatus Nitrosocosmicus arcticus]|uniref:glycosyltransferase family 2 protein n=1 Tax=Candidatus Nitrosocosmicus arcticus TaxID=2035267 RepID=UPI0011A4C98F|nr:glycosyltransferase [Candidatus Nitrosocosmicus arcticus]
MSNLPKFTKTKELDNKRWFVRALLLSAVLAILCTKVFLTIYVIDMGVGIYSILTSFVLFNILFISYFRYRDPYLKVFDKRIPENDKPLVSIVVPVKNEEADISTCIQSCIDQTYQKKEIIVIDDGSTDRTGDILDSIKDKNKSVNLRIVHLKESGGKKKAIEAASKIAHGEIYAFMDSDCDMAVDATEKAVQIFYSDSQVGALTGHGRVKNRHVGGFWDHFLEKLQDVYADGACRAQKGAESVFSSVSCCAGSLSFYRRAAVQDFIPQWARDRFLGMEFKFATDRRMTAHVLSTRPPKIINKSTNEQYAAVPILSVAGMTKRSTYENSFENKDEESKTKQDVNGYWKVLYSQNIRVNIGVPSTLDSLIKQQVRWRKSFIRSLFAAGGIFWKRPLYVALLYYFQTSMKFIRPYIVATTVVYMPLAGDFITPVVWFAGVLFTGMIYAVDFRLRNPGDRNWLYRPFFTLLSTYIYTWLLIYAAITIKKSGWR